MGESMLPSALPAGADTLARPEPVEAARTLLASLATGNATALDIRVLAELMRLWADGNRNGEHEEVHLTLYELGKLVYEQAPDGKTRKRMRASLARLAVTPISADLGAPISSWEQLWAAAAPPIDVRDLASRRGDQLRVRLGSWVTRRLLAGELHAADLQAPPVDGLALRLWLAIRAHEDPASGQASIAAEQAALGRGVNSWRWAREALRPAARRLQRVDPTYASIVVERYERSWQITVERQLAGGSDHTPGDTPSACSADAATSAPSPAPSRAAEEAITTT